LQVAGIGRTDSFFELGGHSLLAMQLIVQTQSLLSVEVPIDTLFENPTLRGFCDRVESLKLEQMLSRISAGGLEIDELFEKVAAMQEGQVSDLIMELKARGRHE
jgi:acyl carrier protein